MIGLPSLPEAHALVARSDLPIPAWLFAWAASGALIVSFFALALAWRRPRLEDEHWRAIRWRVARAVVSLPAQIVCGALGVGLLGVAVYAGLRGTDAPERNLALTFFFVTVWLGFPALSVVFGDVFRPFNPWRAVGRAAGAGATRLGMGRPRPLAYPERLGRWPAAVGLVAFVWLEVVYGVGGVTGAGLTPHTVAVAALVYSAYTLAMMALFGTELWCDRGEVFSVYFGMFSRLGVFEAREGTLGLRRPLAAATRWANVPGSLAVVVASIGTTSFDGAQEGAFKDGIEALEESLLDAGLGAVTALRLTDTIFLLLTIAGIAAVYLIGVWGMRSIGGGRSFAALRSRFAHSLIPIAFAYLLAHYFSLFFFQEQAQFTYLLSDPLGTGTTDLFGTAGAGIDYAALSARTIWYVQVAALIAGHVLGLTLAHDRALVLWRDPRDASRSQYWMLAVMVALTCFGLYLLSVANR